MTMMEQSITLYNIYWYLLIFCLPQYDYVRSSRLGNDLTSKTGSHRSLSSSSTSIGTYSTIPIYQSWHIFNDSLSGILEDESVSSVANDIRKSWTTASGNSPANGAASSSAYKQLFFNYAIDTIYKHQHPHDCSKVQYLVSSGYNHGYFHDIHVEGYGLAMALEMDRVYVPSRRNTITSKYHQHNDTFDCYDMTSVDCYYDLWTNCTWFDLDPIVFRQRNAIRVLRSNKDINVEFSQTGRIPNELKMKYKNENVLGIDIHDKDSVFRRLVPKQFWDIVNQISIPDTKRYYWWRGISASYLLRPNEIMKKAISSYSHKVVDTIKGNCVAVYVRQGRDRIGSGIGEESSVVEAGSVHAFKEYSLIAGQLWDSIYSSNETIRKGTRTLVLGTDAASTLQDALDWGKKRGWQILINPLMLEAMIAKGDPSAKSLRLPALEFVASAVTLVDMLHCDSFVCTLSSNFCRLLDEFRAMIAAKPTAPFADLSEESCWEPPCIGPSKFKWMGW